MKLARFLGVSFLILVAATEKPVTFVPYKLDVFTGEYRNDGMVAQVVSLSEGKYQAVLLKDDKPIATLTGDGKALGGDGWTGSIVQSHLQLAKDSEKLELEKFKRTSPTIGAAPPAGAVVLFDGKNLDAWAKKAGKDWLKEDGPAPWLLLDGAIEVVPGSDCIITHQKFGNFHLHVEFRTLGSPTNSGIFLQDRYEVNINESFARPNISPNGGLDNCTDKVLPKLRPTLPPLEWQTYDIDFKAPRFDSSNRKTQAARITVRLNGVTIYEHQELDVPHGAAARLGEAPTGPLMLQEHGMPLQFRNIWLVEGEMKN